MSKKGKIGMGTILGILVAVFFVVVGAIYVGVQMTAKGVPSKECTSNEDCPSNQECTRGYCQPIITGGKQFSNYYFELDFEAIDANAQDSEADKEVDIFEWTDEANADLVDDAILDCSNAVPIVWDGSTATYELKEENKCVMNFYKFFIDSNYNAGDEETKIDDSVSKHSVDQNASASHKVKATDSYLVVVTESASTDVWDQEPVAFLLTSDETTTYEVEKVEDGTVIFTIEYDYYSDAMKESQYTWDGECTDSEGTSPDLGSDLSGAFDSSLGSSKYTNFDLDCDLELKISKDGYRFFFENPLADGDTERSYLYAYPYVAGTVNSTHCNWNTITDPALSGAGVVKYNTAPTSAGNHSYWESLQACGVEIMDSSTTNANVNIGEKLHQGTEITCLKDAFDDDAITEIPVKVTNIVAVNNSLSTATDESLTTDCGDEILGNGDKIVNISVYSLTSTTPISAVLQG